MTGVRLWPVLAGLVAALGCADSAPRQTSPPVHQTAAAVRAERRAYDGAPPIIPHETFSANCGSCHDAAGVAIPGFGFAPPSPHEITAGMSGVSRCRQCHVEQRIRSEYRASRFAGLRQDLRRGPRAYASAPPVMPHAAFMRENCAACHGGPAGRDEIRTSHPERARCRQCHLERSATTRFERS